MLARKMLASALELYLDSYGFEALVAELGSLHGTQQTLAVPVEPTDCLRQSTSTKTDMPAHSRWSDLVDSEDSSD